MATRIVTPALASYTVKPPLTPRPRLLLVPTMAMAADYGFHAGRRWLIGRPVSPKE